MRTSRRFNPMTNRFDELETRQTGVGAKQKGTLEGASEIQKLLTDLQGGGPEARGAAENRTATVTRPGKVATRVAEGEATWPQTKREIDYREGLTRSRETSTPSVGVGHDAAGNEIPLLIDKRTGKATAVELPEGMKGGKPTRLTQTQQTTQADLNTAETTGVKLLEQLRATKLDQTNDPGDPRLQKFLVNTLKIAPQDAAKAGVQWDAAFINATLSRTLMGGRPSQYIAELMQPHLPQQAMSGRQLAQVMARVLGTIHDKRKELAGVSKVPLSQLTPKSGKSYEEYRNEREGVAVPASVKPMYTVGPNGELVPVK